MRGFRVQGLEGFRKDLSAMKADIWKTPLADGLISKFTTPTWFRVWGLGDQLRLSSG